MSTLEIVSQVAAITFGGGFLTWYWTMRGDRRAEYRQLDDAYSKLLEEYRKHTAFGVRENTRNFTTRFQGQTRDEYHWFAMTVHNTMETLFDVLKDPANASAHPEWSRIFLFQTALHLEWLDKNSDAFEPAYVDYVFEQARNEPLHDVPRLRGSHAVLQPGARATPTTGMTLRIADRRSGPARTD